MIGSKTNLILAISLIAMSAASCISTDSYSPNTALQAPNVNVPAAAPSYLESAYHFAEPPCGSNAELTTIRDMVPVDRVEFGFSCGENGRLHISFSTDGVLQGKPSLLGADSEEKPIPLSLWKISEDVATETALRGGGTAFLNANPAGYIFSRTLFNNSDIAIDKAHQFEWEIEFVTPDFSKQSSFFVDAYAGNILGVYNR
jgi:hypothetical protein